MKNIISIEILALVLWIIDIGILCFGIVIIYFQQRRTKTYFYIGLIFLCIGFIVGRIFKIIAKFVIREPSVGSYNKNALSLLNIYFCVLFGIILLIGAISFYITKIQGIKFYIFWIILLVVCIITTYYVSMLIETNVGELPKISVLKGDLLIFESIYLVSSYIGYLILIICVETVSKDLFYVNKTQHFFSIITIIGIIIILIQYLTAASIGDLLIIFFMASMAGLFLVFLSMAAKSEGEIRRNSIYLCIGHILLVLCYGIDTREGIIMFGVLNNTLSMLVPPIFHIIGLLFYFRGLLPVIFRQRKK